ncbi:sugar phosphate isomerase/epimerase family protein [Polynucleobacter sphagniphilus]|uniref:sugar phosphate isomerase/epimerase family protein n=1 Tax=Polynucleobacter sphagniphilus TaxID=1743169 RepID=UPI00096B9415|nr:TIM barrel protein [Polynucleobacter sphagniphilus]OLY97122.1 xylose isomerase [Polynucleobacter sphagniphilus]
MRIAISNIAWDVKEDEVVASLLYRYGIDAIDIAPGKYFPDPINATNEEISSVKNWWLKRGIEITGMQALLFGTSGLNIFGSQASQDAMLSHLAAVCRIAKGLGATRLVFGSPKNRDRSGLTDEEAMRVAIPFFQRLGDIAQANGVVICLEPNPTCYNANFMTTSAQTSDVVRQVDHPAIKMQLDIGALTINHESAASVVQECASLIRHIHASEPELVPLGDCKTDHIEIATVLKRHLPRHLVSIEMLATKNESHTVSIERALAAAVHFYRNKLNEAEA